MISADGVLCWLSSESRHVTSVPVMYTRWNEDVWWIHYVCVADPLGPVEGTVAQTSFTDIPRCWLCDSSEDVQVVSRSHIAPLTGLRTTCRTVDALKSFLASEDVDMSNAVLRIGEA